MKRVSRFGVQMALALCAILTIASEAWSQGFVRYVATYGSDTNPCTRSQPCRSLFRGHWATPDGGELQILDSGEYHRMLITKSITVSAVGVTASIVVPEASHAVTIDNPNARVVLRGLRMDGKGIAHRGVSLLRAAFVLIDGCTAEFFEREGFSAFDSSADVIVTNSIARLNEEAGISEGIDIVDSSLIEDNPTGISGPGIVSNSTVVGNGTGIRAFRGTVTRTRIIGSDTGVFVGPPGRIILDRSTVAGNDSGLYLSRYDDFTYATAFISNSTFTDNGVGLDAPGRDSQGNRIFSVGTLGNNTVSGNSTDISNPDALFAVAPR